MVSIEDSHCCSPDGRANVSLVKRLRRSHCSVWTCMNGHVCCNRRANTSYLVRLVLCDANYRTNGWEVDICSSFSFVLAGSHSHWHSRFFTLALYPNMKYGYLSHALSTMQSRNSHYPLYPPLPRNSSIRSRGRPRVSMLAESTGSK